MRRLIILGAIAGSFLVGCATTPRDTSNRSTTSDPPTYRRDLLTTPGGAKWELEIGGGYRLDRDYPFSHPYGYSDR